MAKYIVKYKLILLPMLLACMVLSLSGCSDKDTFISQAMEMIDYHQYQDALYLLDEAEEAGEYQRLIDRGRGIACLGLTKYDEAIEAFKACLGRSNGIVEKMDLDVNYYLAACYQQMKDYESAKERYDAIISINKKSEDAYLLRGICHLALSDFESAKNDLDMVYAMDRKNYSRVIEIYQIFDEYGYTGVGEDYLRDVLSNNADNMSKFDIGRIDYFLGEYEQAAMALEQAKEKGGAESYLYLGLAYEATGDLNYAASVYNSFLAKDSSNARIYNQLGVCEMKRGNYSQALTAFENGLKVEDGNVNQTLRFNEIVAYEYLGDFETATSKMKTYLSSYPDDEEALREQIFLSTR